VRQVNIREDINKATDASYIAYLIRNNEITLDQVRKELDAGINDILMRIQSYLEEER